MKLSSIRWLFSLPAAMFYCCLVASLCSPRTALGGPAALAPILSGWFLAGSVALWILADARRRCRPIPYDFGAFVFFTWPVFAPLYLFSTRRWRAWIPLGCYGLLYFAAALIGSRFSFLFYFMRR